LKLKALSFRQPWANLILQGKKTLDLRSWETKYRGPLAVYASLEVEKEACAAHGVDSTSLTTGALVGIVDLVEVLPLNEAAYQARAAEHLNGRPWRERLFGWVLANPRWIEPPQVVKGRLNLFDVEIPVESDTWKVESAGETAKSQKSKVKLDDLRPSSFDSHSAAEFELRVLPEAEGRYRLAFAQTLVDKNAPAGLTSCPAPVKTRVEVELGGDTLRAVADVVIEALRQNGYKATDLGANRREPFHLDEASGVRLGLVFLAAKPISKASRLEQISHGIRLMTAEELFYWYSKCTTGPAAERAQKALRVLLSDDGR